MLPGWRRNDDCSVNRPAICFGAAMMAAEAISASNLEHRLVDRLAYRRLHCSLAFRQKPKQALGWT